MNFGDKLRTLRQERGLTQPDLAQAMGIEQSYLSKLENGKSLPSNDMLHRILDVFQLEVGDLVDDLDQGVRNQLRHIPDIAAHFNHQKQMLIGNRRRWLLLSALLLAFGAALIYAGQVHLLVPNVVYQYASEGVVRAGESKEIFRHQSVPLGASQEEIAAQRNDLLSRIDEDYLQTRDYRGSVFNVPVAGGSRTYYLSGEVETAPWQNKAITLLGLLMAVFGLTGLVLERKLSRFQ